MAAQLPTGTVTFLLTDVEGSTRLWEEHPEAMGRALIQHDALVEFLTEQHGGRVVRPRGEGDARFCVFARATDAVAAALVIQRALRAESWPTPEPLRVRMALHTGEADPREGDYYGPAVNRCARLRALAHGGQTLLSQATADLVRDALRDGLALQDLGEQRLRDLSAPERVFQLTDPARPDDFPPPRSLGAVPHNLPLQVTSFVGREAELAEVERLLGSSRLVTLTGTGGAGKTRLALQVAADVLEGYPDGAWLVELAPIADPGLVVAAAAAALGVREASNRPLLAALLDYLRPRWLVVVLDNCEHLVDACARLADAFVHAAPGVRVLATSREALGIAGETAWRVPSLSLPDPDAAPTIGGVGQSEAIRLFVDRARLVRPAFRITDENAPALARVCHRLDGIPLAIELAAARVRVLTVDEIAARLDDRFALLTAGSRTAPRRQQTLRALVDWSHDLLDPAERALFRRLAVFAGGWTLEAAETVCAGGAVAAGRVLDLLTGLIDKSLVVADEGEDGSRYRLLETIRQYAAQKLAEAGEDAAGGEGDALRRRHAAYYRALGQPAAEQAERSHSRRPLEPLRPELGNLWAALRWAIDDGDAPGALRLGLVLGHLVDQFGHLTEARELLAVVLGAAGSADPAARARVLDKAADLAFAQGDYAAAEALRREQMAVAEELGDRGAYAHALNWLGSIARDRGDQAQARARLEESLAICREIGDRHGVALALSRLGTVAHLTGQAARARALYEESAAIWRDRGDDYFRAWSLHSLALLALDEGDPGAARALGLESLALRRAVGDRSGTVYSLALFASLAAAEPARDPHYAERALRLAGAIAALWQGTTAPLMPLYRDHLERWLTVARRTLGAPAAAAADAAGRGMTLAQALDEAVRDAGPM